MLFKKRIRAELLGFDHGLFTLQTDRPVTTESFKARAVFGATRFRARFQVLRTLAPSPVLEERARALGFPARAHLYCCRLEFPPLEILTVQHELKPIHLRSSPRIERRLRVLSPRLPQYLALAGDLSVEGIGLTCSGPLAEGEYLPLRIDLDDDAVEVDAEVRWCRPSGHRWHAAGARFVEVDRSARNALANFVQSGLSGAAI